MKIAQQSNYLAPSSPPSLPRLTLDAPADAAPHELQELLLRLRQEAVLAQRQRHAGVLRGGAAVPKPKGHVLLRERAVQVAQRVKAAHVRREQHHVALQHGYGYVPRMHVPPHVLYHLSRDLGLRLALGDALQQRLPNRGAQRHRLPRVVLLGQQLDDGLGQRGLRRAGRQAGGRAGRQAGGQAGRQVETRIHKTGRQSQP